MLNAQKALISRFERFSVRSCRGSAEDSLERHNDEISVLLRRFIARVFLVFEKNRKSGVIFSFLGEPDAGFRRCALRMSAPFP